MLEAARLALCEVGALDSDDPMPPFALRMSGNLTFLVYPPGQAFYLVKVGLQTDLRREFDGFCAGYAAFPRSVPRPLALSRHSSFATLVTMGIRLRPLGFASMRAPPRALKEGLGGFFAGASTAFRVKAIVPHSQRLRDAFDPLAATLPDGARRYVETLAAEVDCLPAVRQHGDFSVSNLGMHNDTLVIVDWEDFGRECVPGYDLALLLLSLNDFDAARVRANTAASAAHAWILEAGSAGIGMPAELFLRLLPAYLALTVHMKTEAVYGHALRSRALDALCAALRQPDANIAAGAAA